MRHHWDQAVEHGASGVANRDPDGPYRVVVHREASDTIQRLRVYLDAHTVVYCCTAQMVWTVGAYGVPWYCSVLHEGPGVKRKEMLVQLDLGMLDDRWIPLARRPTRSTSAVSRWQQPARVRADMC